MGVPTGDMLAPGAAFSQGTAVVNPVDDVTTGPSQKDSEADAVAVVVDESLCEPRQFFSECTS